MSKTPLILVVDDEPAIRRLFGAQLALAKYEVLYAKDGNEGREIARRFQPDLILMDLEMPVMDGMEAASRMRTEEVTKQIPIIMLTNADLSIDVQHSLKELGVDQYIHKSEDWDVINKHIKQSLKAEHGYDKK